MASRKRDQTDKVCDVCGDIGFGEDLVTCNHCNKNAEHIYCMKDQLHELHALWYCQECLSVVQGAEKTSKNQKIFHAASDFETSKATPERSVPLSCKASPGLLCDDKNRTRGQKPIVSEAGSHKMLDSQGEGKVRVLDSPSGNSVMEPLFRRAQESIATKKPVTTKEVAYLESGLKPSILIPQLSVRTAINISTSANSQANQDLSQTNKRHDDAYAHRSSRCIITEQVVSNKLNSINPGQQRNRHEKDERIPKLKNSGMAVHSDYEFKTIGSQTTERAQSINPDEKLPRNHAPQACWKGTFEILELGTHVYQGIQAYFPCVLNPKIDKISKDLPEKLMFRVSTRESVWPKIFQLNPPTKEDIGLYFFSCELGRSKEKYTRLLERLASRDSALQVCVKDVQFLIFSSYQLPMDSQRIDGEAYLWGVFRHSHKKLSMRTKVECPCNTATATKCDRLNVQLQRNPVDIVGRKDNVKTDAAMSSTMTSPGFPAPNSRDFKYISSSDKFLLKKVGYAVEPDIPPGFSKIRPPGFTELRGGAELNVPLDSKSMDIDLRRDREMGKPSVLIPSIDTPHGVSEPNSREFNYVKSSLVEFPSTKVANPIDLDVLPGFSKLSPHGTKVGVNAKCHQDLDIWCKSAEHPGNSSLTCSKQKRGFNSPGSPAADVKLHFTSKNLPSPTKKIVCGSSENHSSWMGRICPTSSPVPISVSHDKPLGKSGTCCSPAARSNDCVQPSVLSERNPGEVMKVDMPGNKKIGKKHVSTLPDSSEVDMEVDMEIDMSGDTKIDRKDICSTSSPGPVSMFHDKPSSKFGPFFSAAARSNDYAQIDVFSERDPEEVTKVGMPGNAKVDRRDVPVRTVDTLPDSSEVDMEVDMEIDMSGAIARKDICIPIVDILPGLSEVDMKTDMSGDTKIVDILPGSSEVDIKAGMPWDTKIDGIDRYIPRFDALTGSLETNSGKKRSFVKFSLKKVTSPICPSVPHCFSELGPPSKPKLPNSGGKISSREDSSKSPCPSKMDNRDTLSSPTGGSYAENVPKICEVQPMCHKVTDCGRKFAKCPSSCSPNLSVERNKSSGSFASPDECRNRKHHSVVKSPSSLYVKGKVHGSSVNSSDERPPATPEERLKNFHERSRDVGATHEQNPELNSMSINLESISTLKRKLLEFKKTAFGKVSSKEDKAVEAREVPRRTSGLQEQQAKIPRETVSDGAEGVGETQCKHKEDSVKEKLNLLPDRSRSSGGSGGTQNSQSESNSGNTQRSFVSTFYNKPSVFLEPRLPPAQKGTSEVQEGKRGVSSKPVSRGRASDQAKGEGKIRRKSLVAAFYASPSISHEPGTKQLRTV